MARPHLVSKWCHLMSSVTMDSAWTISGNLFFTKSVKFGFGELSIGRICPESRDLGPGHGFRACSFENIREKLDFHTFCAPNSWKKTEKRDELGRIVVTGALNRSQKMRKAGADNFPKSSAWKTRKNTWKIKQIPGFFHVLLRISDNQGSGKPGLPVFTKR